MQHVIITATKFLQIKKIQNIILYFITDLIAIKLENQSISHYFSYCRQYFCRFYIETVICKYLGKKNIPYAGNKRYS